MNQRFQLYQFQQTDKQSSSRKAGSDDEMNFISVVEYQSLEKNVRKYHVLALQEIREFWYVSAVTLVKYSDIQARCS